MASQPRILVGENVMMNFRVWTAIAAIVCATAAQAQDFPSRSIHFIVPAAAGGPTDATARLIANSMQQTLGQTIVVDPKPGGGGNIGAEAVARAEPDGYTILMATIGTHAINQTLYKKLPFDPIKDFAPVSQVVQYPLILVVNPNLPVKSVKELIAYAKAKPGKLNRASGGSGTSMHLSGELFVHQAGIDMPHIPYKGSAPALIDLVAGHVDVMFDSMITALPLVKAGKLRALAVTGTQRSPVVPDLPTVAEAGLPGYSAYGWIGVVAPAGTPKATVNKLSESIAKALKDPAVSEKLVAQAAEPVGSTPEQFAEFIRSETAKWAVAIRGAKLSIE
jgi:tripartite-type tricarboxylate transporter receptor subunit TctC